MSEYCKECDSVTIKIKGRDLGSIGLIGFAIVFGVLGYLIFDLYPVSNLELMLIATIGIILVFSYSLAYNVFRHSKLKETEE